MHRGLHRAALAAGLLPMAALAVKAARGTLGPDPIETLTHESGEWALRCLALCLAITPMRRGLGLAWLAPYRRTLGLLTFAYAALHVLVYSVLDQELRLDAIVEDVIERPYVTAGFAAFALLVPLAFTSTRAMMRRLGRSWSRLHRGVYAAALLALLHLFWLTKADYLEPAIYAGIFAALLAFRVAPVLRRRAQVGSGAGVSGPLSGSSGEDASSGSA